jgi:3'-phosphoadenosine 5'-phosphosulfate sulfotransferase (PAPS reductase)/FAD synthetase
MAKFLDNIGHTGERRLIHADLGMIEHKESIEQAHRLGEHVGWEVIVVRRQKGGLLSRFEQRWNDNCERYKKLSCVTLISPWPTKGMPFCRSETKVAPIIQEATCRFPGREIVNAVGLRREESAERAKKPVSQHNVKLSARGCTGRDYFPILDLPIEKVWLIHKNENFKAHPGYTDRQNERISCSFCFLASDNDIKAGLRDPHNHRSYIRLCALEVLSGFSYRPTKWLCDEAPDLLPEEIRSEIAGAQEKAIKRRILEKGNPKELLFKNHGGAKAWPQFQPTLAQCGIIATVRSEVASLMQLEIKHTTAESVYARYAELLEEKALKDRETDRKANNQVRRKLQLSSRTITDPGFSEEIPITIAHPDGNGNLAQPRLF